MIAMAPVQQKNKKYDLKFKLSVVKYAEENLGEAAAGCTPRESVPQNDQGDGETNVRHPE